MKYRKTILIAEDIQNNQTQFNEILGAFYNLIFVSDDKQAFSALMKDANHIDLVLLDISMPNKVLHYLKKSHLFNQIPVIVVGNPCDLDIISAFDFEIDSSIFKPLDANIVLKKVESVLAYYERKDRNLENAIQLDSLTGLLNTHPFIEKSEKYIQKYRENACLQKYAFLYTNIVGFKYYKMSYGMQAGNQIIQDIGNQLKEIQGDNNLLSRFDNDHFVALIQQDVILEKAQQIADDFDRKFATNGIKFKIGVYHLQQFDNNVSAAIDFAKVACESIHDSKQSICIFGADNARNLQITAHVLQNLDDAIEKDYIKVFYQPVIRNVTGALCGMEALGRWQDPMYGMLSPANFIPVLEKSRLITKFDLHILRIICSEMKALEERQEKIVPVSFNLSRVDFIDCDIFEEVEKIVNEYHISRDRIHIEITESTVLENPMLINEYVQKFRAVGYQVWMDDFGSGYSALNLLREFEFDEIKLDMIFLKNFNERSKNVIKSIVGMIKECKFAVLAEGVETKEQYEYLRQIGCTRVQGYYCGKPMPIQDVLQFCKDKNIPIEQHTQHGFFNAMDRVNFITDKTFSIFEFDGKYYKNLFANEAFRSVMKDCEITSFELLHELLNSPLSSLSHQMRELQSYLDVNGSGKDILHTVHGKTVRANIRCISAQGNCRLNVVELDNVTYFKEQSRQELMASAQSMVLALYDTILILDLKTRKPKSKLYGIFGSILETTLPMNSLGQLDLKKIGETIIFKDDQEDFFHFVDWDTVLQRLRAEKRGFITEFLRTKTIVGTYEWKTHTILHMPESGEMVYATRFVPLDDKKLMSKFNLCRNCESEK